MFSAATIELLHSVMPGCPPVTAHNSLASDIDDLVLPLYSKARLAVVDDVQTASVYGNLVFRALEKNATHVTLSSPRADDETASILREKTASCDVLVAVGRGGGVLVLQLRDEQLHERVLVERR